MNPEKMVCVTRHDPCPICEKPDWCLRSEDGSAAICARVEEGSVKRCGEAGWLHVLRPDERPAARRPVRRRVQVRHQPVKDFASLAEQYVENLTAEMLLGLSDELEVSVGSLRRLGVGHNGAGFTFPMRDGDGRIMGLRVRYASGLKAAVKGSRNGLFIPKDLPAECVLLICEGLTDTAAALDLGFAAVGRPSCNTGTEMLIRFAGGRDVAIVGDSDPPGRVGAEGLARALALHCASVRTLYPPDGAKDLRAWKTAGLSRAELNAKIKATEPASVRISGRVNNRRRTKSHGRQFSRS